MSELHHQIGELIETGTNIYNSEGVLSEALARGHRLVAEAIRYDPDSFLDLVTAWLSKEAA